tara:strand:+ start:371 stop:670 length:300 start_codon:yes stop_codon:yes gene_type:complete
MTLDQIINIQSIIDKRSIRCDTKEFLDQTRFSKSKQQHIRFGDMHIDHFIRVFCNFQDDDFLTFIISLALKKGIMQKVNVKEVVMEDNFNYWKNGKKSN